MPLPPRRPTGSPKPYAVSEIRNTIRKREAAERAAATTAAPPGKTPGTFHFDQIALILAVVIIIGGLAYLPSLFMKKPLLPSQLPAYSGPEGSSASDIPKGFRLGKVCRVSGKADLLAENGLFFRLTLVDGRIVQVKLDAPNPALTNGMTLEMDILPYFVHPSGEAKADGIAFHF